MYTQQKQTNTELSPLHIVIILSLKKFFVWIIFLLVRIELSLLVYCYLLVIYCLILIFKYITVIFSNFLGKARKIFNQITTVDTVCWLLK
jgi:hypothetical protein